MSNEHNEHHDEHGRPRPDDSPPQNKLIFLYTVLAVCALVGLKFVFDSYLDTTRRSIRTTHLERSRATERLADHRESVRESLHGGAMPINQAISQLAERGRGAFPQVRPFPSTDRGAREGWNRRAPEVPAATPEPTESH